MAQERFTIAEAAKALNFKGIGQNKLFNILRERKVLNGDNYPYQKFIDSGYFVTRTSTFHHAGLDREMAHCKPVLTLKGMAWLEARLLEWGYTKLQNASQLSFLRE